MGVCTSIEVFNELLQAHNAQTVHSGQTPLTTLSKVQIIRAIDVSIVLAGCRFPTMDLLLRHAIRCFELEGCSVKPDDMPTSLSRFLADMAQLEEHEQDLVMTVHLLAGMLEGTATVQ